MAKAYIYSSIYAESAELFSNRVDEIASVDGESLDVRINCNGGNPEFGWGMVCSYAEYLGEKSVQIDGKAYSMGFFFACYSPKESVTCLDVSQGLLHRAGYGDWFENSEYFTDDLKTNLANINAKLMEVTKNRIDVKKLEAIMDSKPETKGKKFKDIWSMEGRLNVFLTAKEMKEIGLVGKITTITPKKVKSINAHVMECAAMYQGGHSEMLIPEVEVTAEVPKPQVSNNENNTDMAENNQAEIKAAVEAAVKKERDRVSAWMKFYQFDPNAVSEAISNGDSIMDNQALMADLMIKMNDPKRASATGAAATVTEDGDDNPKTEVEVSEQEAAQASVNAMMGVGTENTEK